MSKKIDLGKDNVKWLLIRLALPSITAQMINALYNIVDRIFIARIPEVGEVALTGVGVTFPIIMLISAFAALIGAGGAPRMAIKMGEGNYNEAERILGNAFAIIIIMSTSLTVIFLIFGEQFLLLFGASNITVHYGTEYLDIYLLGTIFVQITLGLNPYISSQGFAKTAMITVIIGGVLNIILDPIFIFLLDMGVQGAALATLISQCISATWALLFLLSKRSKVKIIYKNMKIKKYIFISIISLGLAPFVMQSTESLVMLVLNTSLQAYGGDSAVAVMTIIGSVMQFMTMPIFGITIAGQPIISYNFGAGNIDRIKKAFKYIFRAAVTYTIVLWLTIMIFPEFFIKLFSDEKELMEMCVWAIRIFMAGTFALGIQFSCQQTFVALGQAKVSLLLAMTRKIFLLIPFALIFPLFISDKVFAVFLAEPVADILAATITYITFKIKINKILDRRVKHLQENKY